MLCEEGEWEDVHGIITNITTLFDLYHFLLSTPNPSYRDAKYKAEMTVLSIVGEVSILQLLPSFVLLWKLKKGMEPLIAAILGIDSLLNICEHLHEVRL